MVLGPGVPTSLSPSQDLSHPDLSFPSITPTNVQSFAALNSFNLDFDILLDQLPSNDALSVLNVPLDQLALTNTFSVPPSLELPPYRPPSTSDRPKQSQNPLRIYATVPRPRKSTSAPTRTATSDLTGSMSFTSITVVYTRRFYRFLAVRMDV